MTTGTSTPTFYPGLLYRDADLGMRWLEEVLGCERREDHRDDEGNVVHAELVFRGAIVMVSTAQIGREPFRSLPAGGRLVYCALDEVDSRTMESKLVPNLFLAGEILDLDGFIGGYNFQAAFSTGWLAGESV